MIITLAISRLEKIEWRGCLIELLLLKRSPSFLKVSAKDSGMWDWDSH